MIADRLCVMKMINHHPNEKYRYDIACEASYLYAPLAHRLGLYSIKSELEDLSLKYTNREIYDQIAHKLNETKRNRDKYIMEFIQPVKQKLEADGLQKTSLPIFPTKTDPNPVFFLMPPPAQTH